MARPRQCRYVQQAPSTDYFKPRGIPLEDLGEVLLSIEGLEALRLADVEGMTATDAAEEMRVSRHTFGRILSEARHVVAEALVQGKALCIDGGTYTLTKKKCCCGHKPCTCAPCSQNNDDTKKQIFAKPVDLRKQKMVKIAVSTDGPSLDDLVDPRFGRAGGYLVVNSDTMEYEYIDNGASQAMAQGAGIAAAESVYKSGAQVVLSGYIGPKAFDALKAAGLQMGQGVKNMTVREAVQKYLAGDIEIATESNKA